MRRYLKMQGKNAVYILLLMVVVLAACKKTESSDADQSLAQLITTATGLVNSSTEGTTLGLLAPGSKATLQTKIDWATFIKDNSGTDIAYNNAKTTLNAAIEAFKGNVVKPGTPKFGISSYFELGSVDDLVPNKTSFTIETKVRLSDLNTDGTAKLGSFITVDDKNLGILFRYTNTGQIAAYINDGGYIGATTAANTLTANKWYHLTYTFDGNNIIIYVDGVKKATTVTNGPKTAKIAAGSPVRLGMARNNVWTATDLRCMHGNLKDVRFWNHALTEAEINANKDKILTGTETGLLAYWPFDLNLGLAVPAAAGKFNAVGSGVTWE